MKRYSDSEAQIIIGRMKKNDLNGLDLLFSRGNTPSFEELEGKTIGSFLAWNPKNPRLIEFFVKILFRSPIGRWTGKKFLSPFGFLANSRQAKEKRGKGVNLFKNRILPQRFRFDTYIKKARSDSRSCLALDYRFYPSLMSGLIDDVRKIEDGVFLGQMYYKFPWKKELWFLGYFVLCAFET